MDKKELFEATLTLARLQRASEPLTRNSEIEPLDASPGQQRIWLLGNIRPGSAINTLTVKCRITGALSVKALEYGLARIIRRHDVLRSSFHHEGKRLTVTIRPFSGSKLPLFDLSGCDNPRQEAEQRILAQAATPIGLDSEVLIRACLFKLGVEEFVLSLSVHHIAFDGWSFNVLMTELCACYEEHLLGEPANIPALKFQYHDIAAWQKSRLAAAELAPLQRYWLKQMEGAPALLSLPTDRARGKVHSGRGASLSGLLSKSLVVDAQACADREGVTLFTLLLAVFTLLLSRYSGEKDIIVGTASANRNRLEFQDMIGLFVNTLPLRAQVTSGQTFSELLAAVSQTVNDALAYQEMPFESLVSLLNPPRDKDSMPIVQVVFNYLKFPQPGWAFPGLSVDIANVSSGAVSFDLTMTVGEADQGMYVWLEYDSGLFEESTIQRFLDHYRNLLARLLHHTGPVFEVSMLSVAEECRCLNEWNNNRTDFPESKYIHQLFEDRVAQAPDKTAIIFGRRKLSYAELNSFANRIAHYLIARGIRPGDIVAVHVGRSLHTPGILLGVLKAGCAYLPLDSGYPTERLRYMLVDSRAAMLITESGLRNALPAGDRHQLVLDGDLRAVSGCSTANPNTVIDVVPELAYVIYTSGSTGKPKGVMGKHQSFVNFIYAFPEIVPLSAEDRFLAATALSFDPHMVELFLPLALGATSVIVDTSILADIPRLQSILVDQSITVAQATPTTWSLLARRRFEPTRPIKILSGGEPIPQALYRYFLDTDTIQAWNVYGPSEATGWSLVKKLDNSGRPNTIGRSINNVSAYVVNKCMQLQPEGVTGELCLAGASLVAGYLNNEPLSNAKFVANPFTRSSRERLYRTGDLARWLADGNLEILGRSDHQVKVHGVRVELGEIENVLEASAWIERALVCLKSDAGNSQLIAYVSLSDHAKKYRLDEADLLEKLRRLLQGKMPNYMVPRQFMVVDTLAVTPSGKIDRQRLPEAHFEPVAQFVEPRSGIERRLCRIWQDSLNVKPVGIDNDFFDLGGDSLAVALAVLAIEQAFQTTVPVSAIFERPTVRQLAQFLATDEKPRIVDATLQRLGGCLVEIHRGSATMPLFLVPGGHGGMLEMTLYARAMRHMGGGLASVRFLGQGG